MRFVAYILLMFLVASCSSRETDFESKASFQKHVNDPDNGFIKQQESNDLIFEAKLVPPLSGENSTECTVHLRIKRKDGGAVLDYGGVDRRMALEREGYLSFDLREDVEMNVEGHSFTPVFHHYERNYGLKPSVDILFNFMNLESDKDVIFQYRDRLFDQGLIRIKFDKELFKTCHVAE